ncbi:hypothetical protein MVEN_00337800 [Mycena venus]|uniref:Uncharacterized protein n=1 Tax=Mycena venus TaxID=2733690 RepID=A0A8H6YT32_9AGAR|nr:hypothetical protein MVEN_00337800 [Mycena venus]
MMVMRTLISGSKIFAGSTLFANEYKNSRPIDLLRADTPFTSPPLNDDFDAFTQRWSRTTRVTTVEPTASGLVDQLEAITRATTPAVAASRRRKKRDNDGHGDVRELVAVAATPERSLRRMKGKDRIKASDVNERTQMAPLAGQDYEMVEYQVLEEGPERTVSISTWREQAIQEADSDDEKSVYYVNPNDYDPLMTGPTVEVFPPPRRTEENIPIALTSSRGVADTNPQNEGTKTYRSVSKAPPHSSGPRTSTPREGSGTLIQTSSPFHARKSKSGSTISSIHLTPAPTLEHILVSCEPSLLHICPVLQRVGIVGTEHLRAVGKLSEDTRNKEVREEVLKLGVTVIEWAMLVDKMQSL